jgi:hypothetical protein
MPLVLAESYDDKTREQIEGHVAAVQARRMVAAMEYHAGVRQKLNHESDKVRRKMERQYEMLGKELERLEAAEIKVLDRIETLEALKQELGLITDMGNMPDDQINSGD